MQWNQRIIPSSSFSLCVLPITESSLQIKYSHICVYLTDSPISSPYYLTIGLPVVIICQIRKGFHSCENRSSVYIYRSDGMFSFLLYSRKSIFFVGNWPASLETVSKGSSNSQNISREAQPNTEMYELRWRASNNTQPCNNWRRGFRFTALEPPSRSCRGHPCCHATCLVPRLFVGLYWPRRELSATLYVLRTMAMPTANLGEIPCYFSVRLKNQLNNFSRNGLRIQLLH